MTPFVAVVSARRPANVVKMERHLAGLEPVWFVPKEEAYDYADAGAVEVCGSGDLVESRNVALNTAFEQGRPCVQLSDDLGTVKLLTGEKATRPATVAEAIDTVLSELEKRDLYLGGAAPTANAFFAKARVATNLFIVGDFHVVRPCDLRFDEKLSLKEDYDYTLQHLDRYGGVARVDSILMAFRHRTNRGGAVSYRTPAAEQEAIAYLKEKWGDSIRDNSRRPNEVLMRWKPAPS